jgi:hypothetical protein
VCKCRAAPPPRKHPTVSGKIRIEQTFGRARTCAIFCSCGRNADELRVFVARRRLLFCVVGAFARAVSTRFRSRESVRRNGFTKSKFFCGELPKRRSGRCSGAQNARIGSRRFAFAARSEAVGALARRPRGGDFRRHARARAPCAAEFSRARTPETVALRCRDAS